MLKTVAGLLCVGLALCVGVVSAQEKPGEAKMSKSAMLAKQKLMSPETMTAAKKSMMGKDSMVPGMVAKEMVQQELMHDKDAMGMLKKAGMAEPPADSMLSDEHGMSAGKAMLDEPTAMQTLFQELVARHIAAKKIAMMKKGDAKSTSMAGKQMKSMMMDKEAVMEAHEEMMTSEESAMRMAREELIHSLMLDKEVMAMVEKEAKMQEDPKMAPMMSADKMKMDGEAMTKDKKKAKAMMQETMLRSMVDGKQKMQKGDAKPKK